MIAHNFPQYFHPFVGRKTELSEVTERLLNPDCHLLTITGPGGIGKTRLVIQASLALVKAKTSSHLVAQDGAYFVALQGLISADFNLATIADSLNLKFSSDSDPEEQLLRYLRPKSILLVLDNFEHLLDGVGLISRLLATAPRLKVLTTSREALNLEEEWLFQLGGMSFPSDKANYAPNGDYDSVQLFAINAHNLDPTFSLDQEREGVLRICRLVEGMPLALELAASWVRSLSTSDIADELEQGLDILETRATNFPARHRNMRAALNASWNRLSESEQSVFNKLTVFRGGFTREAAQAVAQASRHTLAGLVDKSWLKRDSSGRYDIHELLRQFGEEQLNQGAVELEQAHKGHSMYFGNFLGQRQEAQSGNEVGKIRRELEIELENFRAFWEWAVSHRREKDIAAAMDSFWIFYDNAGRYYEGEQAFAKLVNALCDEQNEGEKMLLFAKALMYQGAFCYSLDRVSQARSLLNKSRKILERIDSPEDLTFCIFRVNTIIVQLEGITPESQANSQIMIDLNQKLGNPDFLAEVEMGIGATHELAGRPQEAYRHYQQTFDLLKSSRNFMFIAELKLYASRCAFNLRNYSEAYKYGSESLAYYQESGIIWAIAWANRNISNAAWGLRRYAEARHYLLEALTLESEHQLIHFILASLLSMARLCLEEEKYERGVELLNIHTPAGTIFHAYSPEKEELLTQLQAQLPEDVFITAVKGGNSWDFDAAIQDVLAELRQHEQASPRDVAKPLTRRESEVLLLVARGKSNQAIADELVLTLGSVKWYMSEILSKLDVANRTEAVAKARDMNLLSN